MIVGVSAIGSADSYKIVLDRGFVVYQQNSPIRMVGSLQDISEIKQLEARLFREKLKKQKQIAEAILRAQEQERTRMGHELHDNVNQILSPRLADREWPFYGAYK